MYIPIFGLLFGGQFEKTSNIVDPQNGNNSRGTVRALVKFGEVDSLGELGAPS